MQRRGGGAAGQGLGKGLMDDDDEFERAAAAAKQQAIVCDMCTHRYPVVTVLKSVMRFFDVFSPRGPPCHN